VSDTTTDSRSPELPDHNERAEQHLEQAVRQSDAAAWMSGGAGTGDTGRNNGLRVAVALVLTALAIKFLGWAGLAIIAALVVSIVLHEAGHFLTAKACGMKATEFFVGFGPRLFSFRKGETEYGLKAIPAGAYVKIIGMSSFEEVDPADEPRTYRAQGTFKRIAAVAAGPAMNLLIAFVLFATVFLVQGKPVDTWSIKAIEPGSAAADAGLQEGDQLVSLDGQAIGKFDDFSPLIASKAADQVDMVVIRDGQTLTKTVQLGWRLDADTAAAFPSTPKLRASDVIAGYRVDGGAPVTLTSYAQLRDVLAQTGPTVTLDIVRSRAADDGTTAHNHYDLPVTRPYSLPADGAAGFLGVRPTDPATEPVGPLAAAKESAGFMGNGVTATLSAFGRILTPSGIANLYSQLGDAANQAPAPAAGTAGVLTPVGGSPSPNDAPALSEDRPMSIIGAITIGRSAAGLGWAAFLSVVAGVNLALGLLNLIPMLPLDGGHIAIASYEGIRGRIRGRRYTADITKLMPVVYAFLAVLAVIALPTLLLDVLQRPSLR
jgi:membrane-associated protease RseP (regulator of RpoE activity)